MNPQSNKPKQESQFDRKVEKTPLASVTPAPIVNEMETSYLDYAMSIIVSRALPDVRDGLKPVHRRILFAMWKMGLRSQARFRKSATVVGEVLGKYHPHGDVAVYDSLVRLAQNFSVRYPLVEGQGNFGSMDGDAPAAMRYTESRLDRIADEMLFDIEKETVNFIPNYDGTIHEPVVLPSKIPQLLLNGTVGIAVGMATTIPPHNLVEVANGIIRLIQNPGATLDDLLSDIHGPDFPTGGILYNIEDIKQAYATGKGGIVLRGRAEVIEKKNGEFAIIITEIPYQLNKSTFLEKIAEIVKDKRIEGIKDLRDESSKDGVRIVIDLKKETYPKKILNRLYALTPLQTTLHVNMLALVEGGTQPRVLTLKTILEEFIRHRQDIIRRRTQFDLNRALDRAHILEGLKKAQDHINDVIKIIRHSKDKESAKVNLMKRFQFTELQTMAILDMRLSQLANLERQKIEDELKEKRKLVRELRDILDHPKKILDIIRHDCEELKTAYPSPRQTEIINHAVKNFSPEDLIPKEATIIMITRDGYIKRVTTDTFKTQSRGGKGVIGLTTKEEDAVKHFFSTHTHAQLLFFTSRGKVFSLKAHEVPQASRTAKGHAVVNFLQLAPEETISAILSAPDLKTFKTLVMVTKYGLIKKVDIENFLSIRQSGLIAIKLKNDDQLRWIKPSSGSDDISLVTRHGQSIRFKEKNIREMGRVASGVRGIRMKQNDEVVGMDIIEKGRPEKSASLCTVMEHGFGKRTSLSQYKVQGRGGSGVKTAKINAKTGNICSAFLVADSDELKDLVIISKHGQVIRLPLHSVPKTGRATQGVRLMRFKEPNDGVASVTFI